MHAWIERQAQLADIAGRQLFFVGGAPRSGTTWLQCLLDAHPDISCHGEGHFLKLLAEPIGAAMANRRAALEAKNTALFERTGGYPLPIGEDTEFLVRTAILLALRQQCNETSYRAVGEKTPENVFFFANLKHMFPHAKFIGIARDPRDSLTSAWHFFRKPGRAEDEVVAKTNFIRMALPSLAQGVRAMLDNQKRHPDDCMIITYDDLLLRAEQTAAALFRFLDVGDAPAVVADCLRLTSFAALSRGRPAGTHQDGSFFRIGISGDWPSTFTPAMSELIVNELGWMFAHFGWIP